MYEHVHACSNIYSSHTCSRASCTQCHTHKELSGNPQTNRHKQCAHFERNCAGWKSWARSRPATISLGPPRPAYFAISWPAAPPAPTRIPARGGPQLTPQLVWPTARTARTAPGPRGLRAPAGCGPQPAPAQGLNVHTRSVFRGNRTILALWLYLI